MGTDLCIYAEILTAENWTPFCGQDWGATRQTSGTFEEHPELIYYYKNYPLAVILGLFLEDAHFITEHRGLPPDLSPAIRKLYLDEFCYPSENGTQWLLASEFAQFDWDALVPAGYDGWRLFPGKTFRHYAQFGSPAGPPRAVIDTWDPKLWDTICPWELTIDGLVERFKTMGPLDKVRLLCWMSP